MDAAFWKERWESDQIGFHKKSVNPKLLEIALKLQLSKGQRVLLPLCGKSLDLIWWKEQGLKVTGVELSEIACQDFFKENNIQYSAQGQKYQSDSIKLIQGDFFDYSHPDPFDFIYDRASTIALPPEMRLNYYKHLKTMMAPGISTLILLTIEYDQKLIEGPPFSVPEAEILEAYSGMEIQKIDDQVSDLDNPRFQGLKVREKIYFIRPL